MFKKEKGEDFLKILSDRKGKKMGWIFVFGKIMIEGGKNIDKVEVELR